MEGSISYGQLKDNVELQIHGSNYQSMDVTNSNKPHNTMEPSSYHGNEDAGIHASASNGMTNGTKNDDNCSNNAATHDSDSRPTGGSEHAQSGTRNRHEPRKGLEGGNQSSTADGKSK